jgi:uncharacterized protein (TIGR01777 family)
MRIAAMLFTLVSCGASTRFALAFASRKAPTKTASSTFLSASLMQEMTQNFQRSFSTARKSDSNFYTIGITGSSGMLGNALIDELTKQETMNGKPIRIVKLSRSDSVAYTKLDDKPLVTAPWNPKATTPDSVIDPSVLADMDAVVHLAGENVATGLGPLGFLGIRPWTNAKKEEIVNSRVGPTKSLAKAIGACDTPTTFLAASGVGVYGCDFIGKSAQSADESFDVSTTSGFLAQLSRNWEAATADAASSKNRVVILRNGVVLSKKGGALAKLYPIFFLGGGGNVGSGQQYFSFISARDAARAYVHMMNTSSLSGPVNVCSPDPCTNAEFTSAFGKVLKRPTILPLPSFVVSALFGEMGDEMLLGGVKALPNKLLKSGFKFESPTITEALESAMKEDI